MRIYGGRIPDGYTVDGGDCDPERRAYLDDAVTPVELPEFDTLEIFTQTESARVAAAKYPMRPEHATAP